MPFKTCITFLRHQLRFYCDTNRQANKIWAVGPKTLTIQRVSAFFLFIFITMFSFYVCRCNIKNRVHQMRAISGNVRNKSHYRSRFAEQSVSLSKNSKKMVAQLIFTHQLIIFNSEHILNNIRQLVCRRVESSHRNTINYGATIFGYCYSITSKILSLQYPFYV